MSQAEEPRFLLDTTGVFMIVALVIVIGPATIFASVWILTHGLDFAATTTFELIATTLVSLLALLMIRAGVSELRGGLGVRVDALGVHRRGRTITWAEIEHVESPGFGLVDIVAGGKSLRLRTYLFREPKGLIDYIGAKTGTPMSTY